MKPTQAQLVPIDVADQAGNEKRQQGLIPTNDTSAAIPQKISFTGNFTKRFEISNPENSWHGTGTRTANVFCNAKTMTCRGFRTCTTIPTKWLEAISQNASYNPIPSGPVLSFATRSSIP
jgi:hypothetical protein